MSLLPTFDCPVCRNPLTWDIVFAHQGVRDAMLALVDGHPDARKLLRPMLSYITLFAPRKTALRYERIATLASELTAMVKGASIERDGAVYAAPLGYWQQGFEEVVARSHTGTLRTPLAGHGYLLEVIAGYARKTDGEAEKKREAQRSGMAGAGTHADRVATPINTSGPTKLDVAVPRKGMPASVLEAVRKPKS